MQKWLHAIMPMLKSLFILMAFNHSARDLNQVGDTLGTSASLPLHSFRLSTSEKKLMEVISPGFDSWFHGCILVYLDVGLKRFF